MSDILVPEEHNSPPPAAVVSLGNQIMTALNKHYPDWMEGWSVSIDTNGGIVQVRNLLLSGDMGFVLKITSIDPEMKTIMRSAGELLERYRIARKKGIDIRESVNSLERNVLGKATYEKD